MAYFTILSNISYCENNRMNIGYYAIDLSSYGVASTYNTIGAYSDSPTDLRFGTRTAYTFTYNLRTIARSYGMDYTKLTANDFITGYKSIPSNRVGCTSTGADNAHVFTGTISVSYEPSTGILTLSNIYNGCLTANNGEGNYRVSNAAFTSSDIICMLVPSSVIVD